MRREDHEYLEIADCFKAIAHPIRIAIMELLHKEGRLNVTELHEHLGLRQAEVSSHLSRLRKYNVVKAEREHLVVYYVINSSFINSLMEFLISNHFK